MDNDVWDHFIITCQRILFILLLLAAIFGFFIGSFVHAQEFDGICRLSVGGKQWSGVAISEDRILTVAHHGETGIVRAEFAETEHGAFNRIGIQATILKSNRKADLSLLGYSSPKWAKIRTYEVKVRNSDRVRIRGYVGMSPRIYEGDVSKRGPYMVEGFRVLTIDCPAVSGMSGSGVFADEGIVGIQFGGTRDHTDAVTVETIQMFLKE